MTANIENNDSNENKLEKLLSHQHSYQNEFHEAVKEVYEDVAAARLDMTQDEIFSTFERLIEPDRTLRFRVEWFDDNNILQVNRGYRVQFNNSFGPYKGGLRFHPSVNESVLKFLGFEQTFKNILTGLPMGGAKGGSDFDPKGKSDHEVRRFCQAFMSELYRHIGPDTDVPAGDFGVGAREIGYLYGQYNKLTNTYNTGTLTGKDLALGGARGREEATGFGCVYFLEEALAANEMKKIKNRRVAISGSGNVALHCAQKIIEREGVVISVSDSGGTLFFKEGLSMKTLEQLKIHKFKKRGRLKEFDSGSSKSEFQAGENPWSLNCEIAIPCATQNELNVEDAKALVSNGLEAVCEGANMPLTAGAIKYISEKKVLFLPAKAANAGGVAVSGFERTQNASHSSEPQKTILSRLKSTMIDIHRHCSEDVEKENGLIPYKKGANLYAFRKLVYIMRALNG